MDDYKRSLIEAYKPIYKAKQSLHEFVRQSWHVLEPQTPFVDGWHIGAICEHLEAVTRRDIKRLIINVPPRTLKTTIVSVNWPAWSWLHNPSERFLCSAHSYSLSERDSLSCRTLIESEWYQHRWGHLFQMSDVENTKTKFANTKRGLRASTSVGSRVTGFGGDTLIGDDLNDTLEVLSDISRNKTNTWLSSVFFSRINDRKTSTIVLMMQRCHENDVTGYTLSKDKGKRWVHLMLPMEYEASRKCKTIILPSTGGKVWEDPRKVDGELLCPSREGPEEVADRKQGMTDYDIAGQLQQRPAPAEGGIIKKSYFQWWKKEKPPNISFTVQSWDTALEAKDHQNNAYSACTTWGLFQNDKKDMCLILLGLWRGRLEYPELRAMAQRLYNDWRDDGSMDIVPDGKHTPSLVLVESKASGSPLIQDLRRAGILAQGFDPTPYGDKLMRVRLATPILQAGRVYVPARPPLYKELRSFSETLVELCAVFPNADARDVVDTMSQALLKLIYSRDLTHPKDDNKNTGSIKPSVKFYGPEGEKD